MRRYIRALLMCTVFAVFSALYVYSKLFETDLSPGKNEARRIYVPPRIPGLREGDPDQTARQSSHRHNRYIMRQRGQLEAGARSRPPMHLAVVACGERLEETLNMFKSAVLFSVNQLQLHIFAEDQLHAGFTEALESWPAFIHSRFNYTVYPISFPSENAAEWKKLFKPCASQRLFLPIILKDVDSLVYVDSDILFLQPVDRLWAFLSQFDALQLAAMAPEHEEPRIAWYNRFARHPYYGKTGINSGVMLMNLTRMRNVFFKNDMTSVGLRWEELLMPLLQKYKLNITWGDQDLLNIIFHYNPEFLLEYSCQWNYRPDHCIYGSNCAAAEEAGIYILHGNRGVYHDHKQPAFRSVYDAIRKKRRDECRLKGWMECLRWRRRRRSVTADAAIILLFLLDGLLCVLLFLLDGLLCVLLFLLDGLLCQTFAPQNGSVAILWVLLPRFYDVTLLRTCVQLQYGTSQNYSCFITARPKRSRKKPSLSVIPKTIQMGAITSLLGTQHQGLELGG
ncbi:glucoside xylosyltransferase 1 isoform X2 [Entelurus aequoreus]|uniref:glucoside xylosyltransferase 1 isoform X2 n=1 Tax=Entelurus aequoreus TaxID=161455 RepID=UPI002B1E182E|nr:glucoside xylosyltransferase 1 isoform X2 [Entelurus aequoreus]